MMAGSSIQVQNLSGPYAGKSYNVANTPTDFWGASTSSSTSPIGGAPNIPSIPAPNISPWEYSTDAKSYPTYLRNLGENIAQKKFQMATNRISAGNSAQNLMHAEDARNTDRLSYMSQAGQQQLGVDNAESDSWNKYLATLANLFGTQVQQRGQDVGYAGQTLSASINGNSRSPGGGMMVLGGGNSQLASKGLGRNNQWGGESLGQSLYDDTRMGGFR